MAYNPHCAPRSPSPMITPASSVANATADALAADWKARLRLVPPAATALLAELAERASDDLATHFYKRLLDDPRTAIFLPHAQLHDHFSPTIEHWMRALLTVSADEVEHVLTINRRVGRADARIGIPVDLVAHGI